MNDLELLTRIEKPSLMKVVLLIGIDSYQTLCNIADLAIVDDGLRLEQRLTFADNVKNTFPLLALEQITEVFIFRLDIHNL